MQRESIANAFDWTDKTMSVLQQRQLEACETRIASLPRHGLFTGVSDQYAEEIWKSSYDAAEHPFPRLLHTIKSLEAMVMVRLRSELALLPMREFDLVGRLLMEDGSTELLDWTEMAPAESLARRLWCTLSTEGDDLFVLHMPEKLRKRMLGELESIEKEHLREQVLLFYYTVMCALDTYGMMYADEAQAYLNNHYTAGTCADDWKQQQRMLRTAFDYIYDANGRMVILHPGMADPGAMLHRLTSVDLEQFAIDDPEDDLPQMVVSNNERFATFQLAGMLNGALRPEIAITTAVDDLRILAKQGVSLHEMESVLASMLVSIPTRGMRDALAHLKACIPAWICVPMREVH